MTEYRLDYDRTIVPQETPYWCGPASVQVVLNSLGIIQTEQALAKELRTHVGGTDWIGQFPAVLNKYTNAGYFHVEMPNDPPQPEQKERLWRDLVASINGGRGVIANIVAPVSNYPRGVKGSQSPRYVGGKVFHYFAVMGYDDDPAARAVWIADSGFPPGGYWMSFDQLATLIPPKGYAAAPGPAKPPTSAKPEPARVFSPEVLAAVMGNPNVSAARYAELFPGFRDAMIAAGCTTFDRAAMWIAQIGHESKGLQYMAELWGPTRDQQTYEGRRDLGNTQPGDGYRYRGRGPIQVTGRGHYTELSRWAHEHGHVPTPTFFVDNPDELATPRYGFLGAVWYWTVERPDINALADKQDLRAVTQRINGGTNGIDDRRARYERARGFGELIVPNSKGDEPLSASEVDHLKEWFRDYMEKFVGPMGSDLKDNREQLTGGRDLVIRDDGTIDVDASFPGWRQLGGRTLVDAASLSLTNQVALGERLDAIEAGQVSDRDAVKAVADRLGRLEGLLVELLDAIGGSKK